MTHAFPTRRSSDLRCGGRHPTRRGRISTHRRRDQTQVGSYLMMHEAPFDHQPRRYSAANEDAVIEDMRAMRAETYGDDVTDPAMDISHTGMVLLLASVRSDGLRVGQECVTRGRPGEVRS